MDTLIRPVGMLSRWGDAAHARGIELWHADGCPGVYYPGVGIVIDWRLPAEEKEAAIRRLVDGIAAREAAE